ncbi:FAD/NAD(P)-binding domain-containing protein [Penicillium angulare]|uniref:FAD/NAD(P)-binding domain-containing protein n=1 Tax=Penicillium angulare TaxID=116970 RepID=UPI0025424CF9|nr:FAD/NAD(P)-binding domain-containing protein [Penicillium angulare]KAJ5291755.1 FAD/NAD(P)-binding domain-containing protein [Penicillium angulare]
MALKVLICGGGCAGPALGFWLAQAGHQVTIVERFPVLRATGAQIDLRSQGIEVAKRMGLLDTIRSKLVDEDGVAIVDSRGKVHATFMANRTGKGAQSLTSEYEIMRGDLIRVLYNATKDNVKYIFGKSVEYFEQDEKRVFVNFSDGSSDIYDILVGADGQGSRIRKAILSPDSPNPCFSLGAHMAYWFIPREDQDSNIRRTYGCSGGRMIMRRTHNSKETQVYFTLRDSNPELASIHRASVEQQKEFWAQRYRDAGWETERFLKGMKTTNNWYCQEVIQVRTDTWSKGRVVLLGDAAYCASPLSGMGTTGALVGAYILAGEICRNPNDLALAFSNYDTTLRPFVDEFQKINTRLIRLAMPESEWGVALIRFMAWLACLFHIPQLLARFNSENKGGLLVPDYPELR